MRRIKAERMRRGLTQLDIATMTGLYPSDVSRAERGISWGDHAERIAHALDIDPRRALDNVALEITESNHDAEETV